MSKLHKTWLAILALGFAFPAASVLSRSRKYDDQPAARLSEAHKHDLASNPKYAEDLPDDKLDELMKRIARDEGKEFSDEEAGHFVATLRRKYPFESIRARLPRFLDEARRPPIQLNNAAKEDLQEYETDDGLAARTHGDDVRPQSLQLLHDEEVRAFVARDGNGQGRTPPPSAIHLALELGPPIPFDKGPTLVSIERGGKKIELRESEPRINEILSSEGEGARSYSKSAVAYRSWAKKHNPTLMPTESHLRYLHQSSHDHFLNGTLLGFVRSTKSLDSSPIT
jgi:hypothetical protein